MVFANDRRIEDFNFAIIKNQGGNLAQRVHGLRAYRVGPVRYDFGVTRAPYGQKTQARLLQHGPCVCKAIGVRISASYADPVSFGTGRALRRITARCSSAASFSPSVLLRVLMTNVSYNRAVTGLLIVDPYNAFISEGGKIWSRIKAVSEANSCVPHMLAILNAAPKAKLRVLYAMRRRYRPGDYETWPYIGPRLGGGRVANTALGEASSAPSLRLSRVRSSPVSNGARAALPTRTWTFSSKRTASISSSSLG